MEITIKLNDTDTQDQYVERFLTVLERIADALEDEPEGSDDG
tara:strand:+ start:8621 stop:8746 length:126 start_codon:yes stop_codon:yes gene_type:complete